MEPRKRHGRKGKRSRKTFHSGQCISRSVWPQQLSAHVREVNRILLLALNIKILNQYSLTDLDVH